MGNACYHVPEFVFQFVVSKYKDNNAHKCPFCMGVKRLRTGGGRVTEEWRKLCNDDLYSVAIVIKTTAF
jgi:hypothetical protein